MPEKILLLKDAPPAPPRFDRWETHVRSDLGLTRDDIRAIRKNKLREGTHWVTEKKRVMYCAAGVAELERVLNVTAAAKSAATRPGTIADDPGPLKPTPTLTLIVFRAGLKHRQIIEAHFPDQDPADVRNRVRVRVRNDKNFVKGMEIPVTVLQEGLYLLARACPRSRGRW